MRYLRKLKLFLKTHIINKLKKTVPVYIPVYHNNLLEGKVALITGGTSGIGYEVAKAFLSSGATVVITGRNDNRVKAIASEIESINIEYLDRVKGVGLDSSNVESFEEKLKEVDKILKGRSIDILVNNAGILEGNSFLNVSPEDYGSVLDTNLKGYYFLSQAIARKMIDNNVKGNILNISSSSSLRPAITPYTISKWGVKGLTLGLAKVLTPHGIVVNGLAPGPTSTPMLVDGNYDGIELANIPSKRYATAQEIANLAVVLVSPLSRMVIGDTVYITGGAGNLTVDDIKYDI